MTEEKSLHMHPCITMGVTGASQMYPCPYQGSIQGFNGLKTSVSLRGLLHEWLGWPLGVLLLMCSVWFVPIDSTSLR